MTASTNPRTWLAGDGQGVILVCEGDCPDTPAGDLVVAEYGETATRRPEVRRFPLGDLAEFLTFADTHAYNCTPTEELAADAPHWGPLRALLPADQLDGWMWMARSFYNGVTVEHYKHRETRGYLNLSADGRAWRVEYRVNDSCPPFCSEVHECVAEVVTVNVSPLSVAEAFRQAGVADWSVAK